jgi:hypothetical protein
MSVGIYMDEHVPSAITRGLRKRGVDVLTVQDDQREGDPDDAVISRATELGRILFSQDEDMLRETAIRLRAGSDFSGLAFADQLGITIGQAVDSLELLSTVSEPGQMWNRVEYLPF